METAKERLTRILEYSGEKINGLSTSIGLKRSQGLYDIRDEKIKTISGEIAEKIIKKYPKLNLRWILYGEGDMLIKESNINGKITEAPKGRFPKRIEEGKLIKFYDTDFAAGDIEFYDDHSAIKPAYLMDVPEFSGCTAFRTYGDSMENLIKSGSILFGTKIEDWRSHLEYGQIYGIVCTDKRRYLKYVRKGKEDFFILKSENKEMYDDFPMPKSKIKSIWLIHGWINKRT